MNLLSTFKTSNLIFYSFSFLFLFSFNIEMLGMNSSRAVLLILFPIALLEFLFTRRIYIKSDQLLILIALTLVTLYSWLYPVLIGTNDFGLARQLLTFLLEGFIGAYIFVILLAKNRTFEQVSLMYVFICITQAAIIFLMIFNDSIRTVLFAMMGNDGTLFESYNGGGFRGVGLASSTTYALAIFLSMSLLFLGYLDLKAVSNRLFTLISLPTIFIASLISGRSALVVFALTLLYYLSFVSKKSTWAAYIKNIFGLIILCISIFFALINFFPDIINFYIYVIAPYAFEMFYNFIDGEGISTRSTDALKDMYFPIPIDTFLIGDGYYSDPYNEELYYMRTDAGYMRMILYFGSIFSFIFYSIIMVIFYKTYKNFKMDIYKARIFILLGVIYFVMQYKGTFINASSMAIKLMFFMYFYSYFQRIDKGHLQTKSNISDLRK